MKKKLLLMTVALLCAVGSWAQDAGTYYIQNVSTGKWLGPGNDWGTQASVLDHADYWKLAKISDGVYTLESVVSNGGTDYYLNGTYCDGAATNFTFTAVGGKANTYTIANGSGGLLTVSEKIVDMSGSDASAEVSQWKLWSVDDMAAGMAAATSASPFDATYLIKDHDLGRNNRDYSSWTNTNATKPKTTSNSDWGNNNGEAKNGEAVYSIEAFQKTFEVKQTLSSVPNGRYALKINGFYRQDGSGSLPYLYANSEKTTFPERTGSENDMQSAAVSFVNGNYLSDAATTLVTNNSLTVGVKTDGTSCWVIFKNFHLEYYGNAISYYSPEAFTSPSSAAADTWYAFTVGSAGTYKITSSVATSIRYTQDDREDADTGGDVIPLAANGSTVISLTEGTFYFKSSATSTITIATPTGTDYTAWLANPDFEILKATDGKTEVTKTTNLTSGLYGWTLPADGSEYFNYEVNDASGSSASSQFGNASPKSGTYYYLNRRGWGTPDYELKTTTSLPLPAGTYYFSLYYKAATYNNTNNTDESTLGLQVLDSNSDAIATLSNVRRSYLTTTNNEGTYFANAGWQEMGIIFTLASAETVTFDIKQHMYGEHGRTDMIFDKCQLVQLTNGADVKGLIPDYSFESVSKQSWGGSSSDFSVVTNSDLSTKDGNAYIYKRLNTTRNISQTTGSLAAGFYVLSVNARLAKYNGTSARASISIGSNSTPIREAVAATDYTVAYEAAADAAPTVGYSTKGIYTDHYFDNFRLTYYTTLPDVDVEEKYTTAGNLHENLRTALVAAQTAYAADKSAANYNALQTALCDAMDSYDTFAAKKASLADMTDVTDFIYNPSFEKATGVSTTIDGWTNASSNDFQSQNNTSFSKKSGTYYAERYYDAGDKEIYQQLYGLPAGIYRMDVAAFANENTTNPKIYVTVGETEYATAISSANDYHVYFQYDGSSTLKIGAKATLTGTGWICIDNFRLTYEAASLPASLTAVVGKMNADVNTAQTTAIATYNSSKTIDNYAAARNAIILAEKSVATYTTIKTTYDTYKTKADALDAAGQASFAANEGVTNYTNNLYTDDDISAAETAIAVAYVAAVKAQTEDDAVMTDAMPTGNAGWICEQGNGPNSYATTATETYSDGGSTYAKFSEGKIMYQTVTGLHRGKYEVSFYGIVNSANSVSTVEGENLVQAYANETLLDFDVVKQNSCTPSNYSRTLKSVLNSDGSLEYGLKVKEGVTDAGNWAVCQNVSLTFLGETMSQQAETFTNSTEATSGKWYKFTISTADNYVISSSANATIYYTQDDDDVNADATTNVVFSGTDKLLSLTAGTFYFKTSANSTVTITEMVAGTDLTGFIVNPSFEKGDYSGWTVTTSNDTGAKENSNGTYTMSGADGDYIFNIWATGNTISQTTSESLPVGYYQLTAVMATDAEKTLNVKLGGTTGSKASVDKSTGVAVFAVKQLTEAGTLTIAADAGGSQWYKVDDFRLTYIGSSMPESLTVVTGLMNATVKSTMEEAVETYNSGEKTVENYSTAMAAIAAAQVSKNAYAGVNLEDYLTKVAAVMATTNVYTSEAHNKWYADVETNYLAGVYTDVEVSLLTESGAYSSVSKSANHIDDILLSTWTMGGQQCSDYNKNLYINTWSTEGDNDGSNFRVPFFEYWTTDANSLGATTMVSTMNNLDANREYSLDIWARVRQKDGESAKVAESITVQLGSGSAVDLTDGTQVGSSKFYINHFKAYGTSDASGNLTITITVAENSNISWLSFKDLMLKPKATVTVKANAGKYGTVIFPFTPDISSGFEGIKFYSCSDVVNDYVQITEVATPEANTPYIIKNTTGSNFNTTISDWDVASNASYTVGLLTGACSNLDVNASDSSYKRYVLQTLDEKQAFYLVDEDFTLPAYKCYLTIPTGASVKAFFFPDDTTPTAINGIEDENDENSTIYNLAGQRVNKAQKGIYIINGKKVLFK